VSYFVLSWREADHSFHLAPRLRNAWIYSFMSPYAFIGMVLG